MPQPFKSANKSQASLEKIQDPRDDSKRRCWKCVKEHTKCERPFSDLESPCRRCVEHGRKCSMTQPPGRTYPDTVSYIYSQEKRKSVDNLEQPLNEAASGIVYPGQSMMNEHDTTKPTGWPTEVHPVSVLTRSVPTAPTLVDSGYVSRDFHSRVDLSSNADMRSDSCNVNTLDDDDTASIYSNDTIVTSLREDLIHDFSEQFAKDLALCNLNTMSANDLLDDFENSLLDFSLRLCHENATAEGIAAMKFIHQHRRNLARSFKSQVLNQTSPCLGQDDICLQGASTYSESEGEEQLRFPGQTLSTMEKMELWDQKLTANLAIDFEEGVVISDHQPDRTLVDTKLFEKYYSAIAQTSSYKWLQAAVQNQLHLQWDDADLMRSIRDTVLNSLPRPKRIGRRCVPTATCTIFKVHWPLRHLIRNNPLLHARPDQLGLLLTLTGNLGAAQALPCSIYLEQTWPTTGKALLDLVLKVLQTEQKQTCTRDDGTQISVTETQQNLFVSVEGSRGAAAELGQQLCWLSAALTPMFPGTGVYRATPKLHHIDGSKKSSSEPERRNSSAKKIGQKTQSSSQPKPVSFLITVSTEPLDSALEQDLKSQGGACWLPIFDSAVIVCGYPILRRMQGQLGLELPLNVLAALTKTNFADRLDGKLFIKGHSSMVVSSEAKDDLLMWHYHHGPPHKYMSYFDHEINKTLDLELDRLPYLRHIVGWCEEAHINIGSSSIQSPVKWSGLKPLPSVDSRFVGDGHLFAPMRISDGKPFVLQNQNQFANSVPEDYETIFRRLSGKFALLWDVDQQRGWLVNLLVTLLHLIRISLLIDRGLLDDLFILKPEDLEEPEPGPLAAKKFLSNTHNLRAKVSVSKVSDTLPNEHEILESRMVRFYHTLNEAFDYRRTQSKYNSIASGRLTGWDFRSIANQKGSSMRSICVPAEGMGWVELIKATDAVTFFGNGFGELISAPSNSSLHCEYWRTLPAHRHYVAISAHDLSEMAEAHERDVANDPREFIPNILWYSPHTRHNTCGCESLGCTSSKPVQVLFPSERRSATLAMGKQVDFDRFATGAFVFGHNESVDWQWSDDNEILEISKTAVPDTTSASKSEELSKDSGYETRNIDSSVDALSIIPSGTISEDRQLDLTKSNDNSGARLAQRVYSSASFSGGKSHLGDHLGDKFENCHVNFYQTGPYQSNSLTMNSCLKMPNSSLCPSRRSLEHAESKEDGSEDELQLDEQNRPKQAGLQRENKQQRRPRKQRKRK